MLAWTAYRCVPALCETISCTAEHSCTAEPSTAVSKATRALHLSGEEFTLLEEKREPTYVKRVSSTRV